MSIVRPLRSARHSLLAITLAAIGIMGGPAEPARAQYPERQVTMIVCFPAGGGTDIAARLINTQLAEALGKPVVIENRGGAGGNIGIAAALRAGGDGHTLLVCSSAYVVNPSLYAQVTYDPFKDFIPIMVIGASPNAFVVPAASEIKSMPELIAKAKAAPGKLNWTSPGAGTTPHLAGEVPNVPSLDELGVKDAVSDTFQGIFTPGGVPQPVVDRLVKELGAILARPDIREKFVKAGLPVVAEGPEAFRARIAREVPMYKEIIEKAGLKVQ